MLTTIGVGQHPARKSSALYANDQVFSCHLDDEHAQRGRDVPGDFSSPKLLLPLVFYTLQVEYSNGPAQQCTCLES